MTNFLFSLSRTIQGFNHVTGKALSWLTIAMAITVVFIVTARSVFNYGSISIQESVTYMHASLFMLCLAYTAQQGGHVRVDIFYRRLNDTGKSWVNACGAVLLLLPFSIFLTAVSWNFAAEAWSIHESSINPGGIPAIFLLKTLIPASGLLLSLQGFAEVIRHLLDLTLVDSPLQDSQE